MILVLLNAIMSGNEYVSTYEAIHRVVPEPQLLVQSCLSEFCSCTSSLFKIMLTNHLVIKAVISCM